MRRIHPLETSPGDPEQPEQRQLPERRAVLGSLLALAGILALYALSMAHWVRREARPPALDQAARLELSLEYKRRLGTGGWKELLQLAPKPGNPPFAPLYPLSILYAHHHPDSPRFALWVNCFYLAVLILSVWGLGKFFAGPWTGWAAALLISSSPIVQELYFSQWPDLALTAWVAAAYCALIYSEGFRWYGRSFLFALFFSAGVLTQWSAFSYFLPALVVSFQALQDPHKRWKALGSWAIAAALIAPWGLSHWPVFMSWLTGILADPKIFSWRPLAIFSYLLHMSSGLDTPLWLISLVSLAVPFVGRRQGLGWILPAWFLGSYIFWVFAPHPQLRYLLPAWTSLILLTATAWPKWLLGILCAYQALSAANYSQGWVPSFKPHLGLPLSFFSTFLPAQEDWKIEAILKEAAIKHEKSSSWGALTLAANHPYFNSVNFNWALNRLNLDSIRIRGVDRRLCEFSEFLVLKTGSPAPGDDASQLSQAQNTVLDKNSWFHSGYQELRKWPLPDGSQAVLFQRKPLSKSLLREREIHFQYYEEPDFVAKNIRIHFSPWDSARGVYPQVRLQAQAIYLKGLEIQNLRVLMEDFALAPLQKDSEYLMDFRVLRMKKLSLLFGTVTEGAFCDFIRSRVQSASSAQCALDKNVRVQVTFGWIPLKAEAALSLASQAGRFSGIIVELRKIHVGWIPLPIFRPFSRYMRDFEPSPKFPFEMSFSGLSVAGGRITIGKL